jgi:copper transport protein
MTAGAGSRLTVCAALLGIVLSLALPHSASAHAVLVASRPSWQAVLRGAPHQVRLEYDEDVVAHYARVAVLGPDGRQIGSPPRVIGNIVVVTLPAIGTGSYTVRWKMVAANDGHVTTGAFSFGVRAHPLPPAPESGVSVPVLPQLLAWLQFLGVVLAGGTLTFRALVLVPAARAVGQPTEREASLALWMGTAGAVIALHAGLFGFLVGAYPIVGGGLLNVINTEIIPIRVGTHLGQAWTLTTFAWLGVLALLTGAWVNPRRREPLLAAAGACSLAIAFGISWASHPASKGTLPLAADFAHLVAGAVWVGGVLALAILAIATRPLGRASRDALLRASFVRFSMLAAPTVLVLGAAGLYMALRELPSSASLITTGYGVLLLIKTLVFAAVLGVAAYHRRWVVPRITAGAAVAGLRRSLTVEAGLLIVAVALAAILSQTAPPR